jgi:hypothetical protein
MLPKNLTAARRFVDFATVGEVPSLGMLARCVDELALSYHDTPAGEPDENDDTPPAEIDATYAEIGSRFTAFGYYSTVFGIGVSEEALIGDAIDDILDVTNDLKEVLWRYERFGVDDANWYFRMLYQIHWGEHLRGLANYLYWLERNGET